MKSLAVIGYFVVAVGILSLFLQSGSYATAIGPAALGCLFIFLPRWRARQAIKNASRILDPVEVTISDEGIESSNSVAAGKSSWDAFTRYAETKNLFMVYPNRVMFHIYPRRVFTPDEVDTFRGMLEQRLGAASKAYRRKPSLLLIMIVGSVLLVMALVLMRNRDRDTASPARQDEPDREAPQR